MKATLASLLLMSTACPQPAMARPGDLATEIRTAAANRLAEFVIPAGEHLLPNGLILDGMRDFTLRGEPGAVLKLPPASFAVAGVTARKGEMNIITERSGSLRIGMRLWIEADGEIDAFTKRPKPYFIAKVAKWTPGRIEVANPLAHDIPAGAMIRDADAPNIVELRNCRNIVLRNLTLDGGRKPGDPLIRGHAQLCGILASGKYTYEAGPVEPRPSGLVVRDCLIRQCFGRGVAWYAVVRSEIARTTVEDCADEALDLDHFCVDCRVSGCSLARCRIGVELNDVNRCRVENNTIDRCGTGLSLWRWCRQPGLNEENIVSGNRFTRIEGNGLQVGAGTARNQFLDNTIDTVGRNGFSLHGEGQMLRNNDIRRFQLRAVAVNGGTHDIRP